MNFFSSLIGMSPYALNAIRTRQAEDEAQQQRMLARLYQNDANTRANALNAAQIGHLNAQATKLAQPIPPTKNIMRGPGGQLVDMSDPESPRNVGPAPATKPPPMERIVPVMQGGKRVYLPQSQAVGQEAPSPAPSTGSFTTFQDYNPNDPTAPPTTKVFNTKTGQVGPTLGSGKPQMTKIESATNTAAKARMSAAISEMNNADSNMAQFENELASGHRKINAGSQLLQRVANAFTHDDPLSQLTQSGALAALNASDPELARYIRRGLSFAEGESMISQRPSDFRTRMSAFLSTAASGASPDMIRDIQGRRHSILSPLNSINTPPPQASGAAAPSRSVKPTAKPAGKPKADYGIFGSPSGEDDE